MPKTIIEFSPEEDHELEMCQNGMRYHSALWDFKNYLRSEIKYAEHTNEEYKILEQVQDNFFRILTFCSAVSPVACCKSSRLVLNMLFSRTLVLGLSQRAKPAVALSMSSGSRSKLLILVA